MIAVMTARRSISASSVPAGAAVVKATGAGAAGAGAAGAAGAAAFFLFSNALKAADQKADKDQHDEYGSHTHQSI